MPKDDPRRAFAGYAEETRAALADIAAQQRGIDCLIRQSRQVLTEARATLAEAENVLRRPIR